MAAPAWCRDLNQQLSILRALAGAEEQAAPPAPLGETEVSLFEARQAVTLPQDYRDFIVHVADGGLGPVYGIVPLAAQPVADQFPEPVDLAKPFTGAPPHHGCLFLAEIGCGYFYTLVVSGEHRGQVWSDYTAGDGAVAREADSFRAWIEAWATGELAARLGKAAWDGLNAGGRSPVDAAIRDGAAWIDRLAAAATEAGPVASARWAAAAFTRLYLGDVDGGRAAIAALAALDADDGWLPELR
ncbi:MAG TPA: SMI1/KNR4 family protein, partial [Kofleriaceae bacterium]|nr:SMI1/KNR4 family protein [Kofleriaceae bacterium]